MADYQLVPYFFSVDVHNVRDEHLSLDDVDGKGTTALDFVCKAAKAHMGPPRLPTETASTALQVVKIAQSSGATCLTISSAHRGLAGRISRMRDGALKDVDFIETDWTHVETRVVFVAPPDSKFGVMLVERAGVHGGVSNIRAMLNSAIQSQRPDLRFNAAPAMSEEYVKEWAQKSVVKGIILQRLNAKTGQTLGGQGVMQTMEFKPPKRQSWPFSILKGGLDENATRFIMEQIAPFIPGSSDEDPSEVAAKLLDEEWTAALDLRNGTKTRKVSVTTKTAMTLTFPAGDPRRMGRPLHKEFVGACVNVLKELVEAKLYGGNPSDCGWDDVPWKPKGDEVPWKAVWGVIEPERVERTA